LKKTFILNNRFKRGKWGSTAREAGFEILVPPNQLDQMRLTKLIARSMAGYQNKKGAGDALLPDAYNWLTTYVVYVGENEKGGTPTCRPRPLDRVKGG
jgi:hypothetical protein